MAKLVPIGATSHEELRWKRPPAYSWARTQTMCWIATPELADIVSSMPVAIVENSGAYDLMALMSPIAGRNLYVGPQGEWLGDAVPAALRTYPFRMVRHPERDQLMLCFDEDSGLMSPDDSGEPFFTPEGTPTETIDGILKYLSRLLTSHEHTTSALRTLNEVGAIEPWPLQVQVGGETKTVSGLFRVSESKLRNLDEEAIVRVHKAGALPLAYLQLVSMGNVRRFPKLMAVQDRLAAMQKPATPRPEDMFKMSSDSDVIKFD